MELLPVSICIPVYNEIRFFERTLQSALQQPAREIVISDNHSTDGSLEVAFKYANQDKRIKVLHSEQTIIAPKNFLRAVANARQPYSMLLGAHDILTQNYIKNTFNTLTAHPDAVLAYGDVIHVDKNLETKSSYSYPDKSSLENDNPLTRLLSLAKHLYDGSMWHGLCERKIYLAMLEHRFKNKVDFFALGYLLLHGKFVHTKQSAYIRLSAHEETLKEQGKRYTILTNSKHEIRCPICWTLKQNYKAALYFIKFLSIEKEDAFALRNYFRSIYCNPCPHQLD